MNTITEREELLTGTVQLPLVAPDVSKLSTMSAKDNDDDDDDDKNDNNNKSIAVMRVD